MDFALVDILFSPPVWPDWAIFKNVLFDKLSCKSSPNIVGYFKEYFLAKAALATFWAIYGTNWATFIPTSGHTAWYLLLELEKMVWLTNYLVAMLNITHNYYYKNPVNDTGDVVDDKEMQIRLFSPPWPGKRGWASPAKEKKTNYFRRQKRHCFSRSLLQRNIPSLSHSHVLVCDQFRQAEAHALTRLDKASTTTIGCSLERFRLPMKQQCFTF